MIDPQQNSSRQLMSITPRKKSVRFNITSPSPRIPKLINQNESNHQHHPLNISYTIPSTTINIDHVTNRSHMQHLNNHIEYIPTTRRNNLQIHGEKIHPPPSNLDELQQFMKMKAETLRRNMTDVTTTFNQASEHLNHIKEEQKTVLKRPSRIPVSTRHRSPSPTVVIYKKPQHRSLDDLRWYCLARKFSILWQKKTFGYHLRRIKLFYEKHLLEKYFHLWRTTIKNNPYEQIANEFYQRQLFKTYFYTWLNYNSLTQIAIDHINYKRLQNTWNIWKLQLNKRHLHQQQFITANKQYSRKILSRFYHIWQIHTSQRRQEAEKTLRSNYHYRIHLQRICFNAWLTYGGYRRRKDIHKKRVHEYYQRHLIGRIYSKWKEALTRKYLMQQHEHRLVQLQERILTRWAFEQWKSYIYVLADEQRSMIMAEQYSNRRIMRKTLIALYQYLMKRRMKQRFNWTAVQHRAQMLKRIYYRLWKHRLEQRENIYMHAEYEKAESFYHMKVTIRYWFCWRRYINDCRQENARLRAADTYYNSKLLRKYFHLLLTNVNDERHEKLLEKRADDYYRLRYLQIYYMYWKIQTHAQEQYQINWRIAVEHEEKNIRQKIFNTWLDRAHSRLIDNEQNIVAERHYFRTIITRAWLLWRQLIDELHNEERSERIAIQFYYHTIQRRVLNAWKLYIRHCHYMKQMYRQAEQFHLEHRGKMILFEWLSKAKARRRLMAIVNERFERKQRTLLRQNFRQWRDNAQEEKDDRQLTQYAIDHYNRSLKRKVLLAWNNEMIQQVLFDNENEMKLNKYREEKNHYHLQVVYERWKQRTNKHLRDCFLNQHAQVFYEKILLKRYFSQWKEEHQLNTRVKLLERQAIWFDRMRLTSRVYIHWKQAWQSEQKLNIQKHQALLFWALQLQKNCFLKWLLYVSERKRKRKRYNQATHQRHDELVRNCLRQFLTYTDHTKQRRQALFIHQQVYLYHDRNSLAAKYASKWRAFAKESIARKQLTHRLIQRTTNIVPKVNDPLALVKFDNSPPKLTNRPRPRKPAFLSDSFSSTNINKTENEIPMLNLPSPLASSPPPPPTIDHSLHSPFISVKPTVQIQEGTVSPPVLLPPSAFQLRPVEVKMPLSSRRVTNSKIQLSHRPYSTQPSSSNILINKDNLLDVKQRLEIYLNTKAKLKRLRQQLANLSPLQVDKQLEHECQELSAFIASEKIQLTSILQNL